MYKCGNFILYTRVVSTHLALLKGGLSGAQRPRAVREIRGEKLKPIKVPTEPSRISDGSQHGGTYSGNHRKHP